MEIMLNFLIQSDNIGDYVSLIKEEDYNFKDNVRVVLESGNQYLKISLFSKNIFELKIIINSLIDNINIINKTIRVLEKNEKNKHESY